MAYLPYVPTRSGRCRKRVPLAAATVTTAGASVAQQLSAGRAADSVSASAMKVLRSGVRLSSLRAGLWSHLLVIYHPINNFCPLGTPCVR